MSFLPDAVEQVTDRIWSEQQIKIGEAFESGKDNYIFISRAGTGKTTTALWGANKAPEDSIRFMAFNKRIADELAQRLTNPNAQANTAHSIGYRWVRRNWPRATVGAQRQDRANGLALAVCGSKCPEPIRKLVARLHTLGREVAPHATQAGSLTNLAIDFDCEPEPQFAHDGFDLKYVESKALEAMELASKPPANHEIDFSDMIFLPLRNHWIKPDAQLGVIDEAQDWTVAQLEIAQRSCAGRLCIFGDDRQAIYGFRGADFNSLARLKKELNAKELKLTTTYRCARSIVELAKKIVPDFEAGPGNPDGTIVDIDWEQLTESAQLGNFILSRVNAPLVSVAMNLLKEGKRARIAGRDIGTGLINLVNKIRAASIPDFIVKVQRWEQQQVEHMLQANREDRIEGVRDQANMLVTLAIGANSVYDVTNRIRDLFTDDGLGSKGVITCSSVHKAKGLEADRVMILVDTLYAGKPKGKGASDKRKMEEANIEYVAITRAKNELVRVHGGV